MSSNRTYKMPFHTGPLATPVKEPCKFLVQSVVDSSVSGAPMGVVQECTHPNHKRYIELRKQFKKFIAEVAEIIQAHDNHMFGSSNKSLIIHPSNPKKLIEEYNLSLRAVCKSMNDMLISKYSLDAIQSTEKEFTNDFKEGSHKRTLGAGEDILDP